MENVVGAGDRIKQPQTASLDEPIRPKICNLMDFSKTRSLSSFLKKNGPSINGSTLNTLVIDLSQEDTTFNRDPTQCESIPKPDDYLIDLPNKAIKKRLTKEI